METKSSDQVPAAIPHSKSTWKRTEILLALATIVVALMWYVGTSIPTFTVVGKRKAEKRPLPSLETVDRVVVTRFSTIDHQSQTVRTWTDVDVPPSDWRLLWETIEPATIDDNPAKWMGVGELKITTRNGQSVRLELYDTAKPPGAFEIDRVYYRGGNSQNLQRLLTEIATRGNGQKNQKAEK